MPYSEYYTELLRERVPLLEYINMQYNKTCGNTLYRFNCPLGCGDKDLQFIVSGKNIFKCFHCGVSGSIFNFFMALKGITFPEAIEFVSELSASLYLTQIPSTVKEMFGE